VTNRSNVTVRLVPLKFFLAHFYILFSSEFRLSS
jgi:hypothetical protein